MSNINKIEETFNKHGGILKTSELNALGLSSRQIMDSQHLFRQFF